MKVIENVTIYKCDFCNKQLMRKFAMVRHEERCSANPKNDRPCLGCRHLETKEIEFDTGISTYHGCEPIYRKAKTFYCIAKNILLLHPKTKYLEGRENLSCVLLDNEETEQFEMPTQCDVFDREAIENNREINEYNNLFLNNK
jgi:hypothetical protein